MIKLYEKYTDIKDIKENIIIKAVDTGKIEMIDFFIKRGYDINILEAVSSAMDDYNIFRYFLKKGINPEEFKNDYDFKRKLKLSEIQKALIDFGYENLIYDTVGFNNELKKDPKYADVIQRFEDIGKYNL